MSKYARIERERRFLLTSLPADAGPAQRIEDLYVDGSRLRLRKLTAADGTVVLKLTQKIDVDPAHRSITTLYLTPEEYERLAALPGARLAKRRHPFAWKGVTFGVDVFEGPLGGLVLAEVEADSDAALWSVDLPPFADREVTDRVEYTGGSLARAASPPSI